MSLPMVRMTIPALQPTAHIMSSLFGIVGEVIFGDVAVRKRNINYISVLLACGVAGWCIHITLLTYA